MLSCGGGTLAIIWLGSWPQSALRSGFGLGLYFIPTLFLTLARVRLRVSKPDLTQPDWGWFTPVKDCPIANVSPATAFQAQDINYFDPNPSKKAVKIKDNNSIYYNVFNCTNWLQVKASNKDASKLCKNFNMCLVGKAGVWYIKQLPSLFQIGLRKDCNGIEEWYKALKTEFKRSLAVSLEAYERMQYTVKDVRFFMDYIQIMILYIHGTRIPKDLYQLALAIYHCIDGLLCWDIQCPPKETTVEDTIARICKL